MLERLSLLLGGLPIPAIIALLVLATGQTVLQIYCLIDLVRRPTVVGGRKWLWVLVIVIGSLVGTVIYLALGRSVPASAGGSEGRVASEDARKQAIDRLYGGDR